MKRELIQLEKWFSLRRIKLTSCYKKAWNDLLNLFKENEFYSEDEFLAISKKDSREIHFWNHEEDKVKQFLYEHSFLIPEHNPNLTIESFIRWYKKDHPWCQGIELGIIFQFNFDKLSDHIKFQTLIEEENKYFNVKVDKKELDKFVKLLIEVGQIIPHIYKYHSVEYGGGGITPCGPYSRTLSSFFSQLGYHSGTYGGSHRQSFVFLDKNVGYFLDSTIGQNCGYYNLPKIVSIKLSKAKTKLKKDKWIETFDLSYPFFFFTNGNMYGKSFSNPKEIPEMFETRNKILKWLFKSLFESMREISLQN